MATRRKRKFKNSQELYEFIKAIGTRMDENQKLNEERDFLSDLSSFRIAEGEYMSARKKFLRLEKEFKLIQKEWNKKEKAFYKRKKPKVQKSDK